MAHQPSAPTPEQQPSVPPADVTPGPEEEQDADRTLFGDELYGFVVRHQPVKLDPSIGVVQFRQQRDRLRSLSYVFGSKAKMWYHGQVPEEVN